VSRVGNRPRAEDRAYAVTDRRVSIDGNGNLLSDGTTTYTWDARDRLVSNGYGYDTGNLRVKMGAQKVLLDGIEEAREYGTEVLRYEHDPSRVDGLLAQTTGAGKGYFVTDALGSVYGVVDSTGAEVSKYGYDVYGARTATTEGMPTSWGFAGRRHELAGEMYYRARYLDGNAGRFIQADPTGEADGPNAYTYVQNSPAIAIDPFGLRTLVLVGYPGRIDLSARAQYVSQGEWEAIVERSLLAEDVVASYEKVVVASVLSSSAFAAQAIDIATTNPMGFDRLVYIGHMRICDLPGNDPKCGGAGLGANRQDVFIPPMMGFIGDLLGVTSVRMIGCGGGSLLGTAETATDTNFNNQAKDRGIKFCYTRELLSGELVLSNGRIDRIRWQGTITGASLNDPAVTRCTE
jgi:RHS repeat-associated protein